MKCSKCKKERKQGEMYNTIYYHSRLCVYCVIHDTKMRVERKKIRQREFVDKFNEVWSA